MCSIGLLMRFLMCAPEFDSRTFCPFAIARVASAMASTGNASAAASTSTPIPPASAHAPAAASSSTSDDAASITGALARAGTVIASNIGRVLAGLYRVPLKSFRQNKFDLAEGHQPLVTHTNIGAGTAATSAAKEKPLKVLMSQQGRLAVFRTQIAPSLIANVAVGSVMFAVFDRSMALFAEAQRKGQVPSWVCSNSLSTGVLPSPSDSSSAICKSQFLHPSIGPDVFISGFLAGAAQSILVTPMENSATYLRMQYILRHQLKSRTSHPHAHVSHLSPAVLENTVTGLVPPTPPPDVPRLSLLGSVRSMLIFTPGSPFARSVALRSQEKSPFLPRVTLFSHASFRMARDALGLAVFFYAFEQVHGRMKVLPYRWMEMQEEWNRMDGNQTVPHQLPGRYGSVGVPSSPPPSLLSSLLAWDLVSVLTAGAISGSAYHVVTAPFFSTLQRMENDLVARAPTEDYMVTGGQRHSAWRECRRMAHDHVHPSGTVGHRSWRRFFTSLKAPNLLNPMVIGLCVYTLTKTEHHTQQWKEWTNQRKRNTKENNKHTTTEKKIQ